MNRDKDLYNLIDEIQSNAPAGLDTSVQRAMARARRRRRAVNMIRIPAAAIVALALSFALLVNTSVAFARAVGDIPALKKLAALVAQDPSLKAAVENKYVQPVGESIEIDDVAIHLSYVIADEQSLSAFFSINQKDMPDGDYYLWRGELLTTEDVHINTITKYPQEKKTGILQEIRFNFRKGETLTEDIKLEFLLYRVPEGEPGWNKRHADDPNCGERPTALPAEWTFELHLDPSLVAKGDVRPIGRWVEIGGQRVYLENLTIYPTQAKLNIRTDPANTAIITDLHAWLENGNGKEWAPRSDGLTSTTYWEEYEIVDFYMESPYFSECNDLTLHIDQAALIPKEEIKVTVDYAAGTVSPLPDCIKLLSMEPEGGLLTLAFEIGLEQDYPFWYKTGEGRSIHHLKHDVPNFENNSRTFQISIEDYDNPVTLHLVRVPREDIEPIAIDIK
jgi:hypothetical protein